VGNGLPPLFWHHVDCYALQHPGGAATDRRQRQSVAVHLTSLGMVFGLAVPSDVVVRRRTTLSSTILTRLGLDDWPFLEPPTSVGDITAADVLAAAGAGDGRLFKEWASAVWSAWSSHHATARTWAAAAVGGAG
jgi:hypothetical protein